jgi:hypothetical protein
MPACENERPQASMTSTRCRKLTFSTGEKSSGLMARKRGPYSVQTCTNIVRVQT